MLIWFHLHVFSVILRLLQWSIDFQVKQDMNFKCKMYIQTKKPKQQTTALKKDYKGAHRPGLDNILHKLPLLEKWIFN